MKLNVYINNKKKIPKKISPPTISKVSWMILVKSGINTHVNNTVQTVKEKKKIMLKHITEGKYDTSFRLQQKTYEFLKIFKFFHKKYME